MSCLVLDQARSLEGGYAANARCKVILGRIAAGALVLLLGACSSSSTAELESTGTDVVEQSETATTMAGSVEASLTVATPEIGGVFASPSSVTGESSSPTVDYELSAGGMVLAEGTIDVTDGKFSTMVEFTNTCCIEMMLEVTQPGDGGLTLTIPVAYPEPG